MENPQVRVGVGVFIIKNNTLLLGKRKVKHGDGYYGLPGGHLEVGEEIFDCVKREVKEETNLTIKDIKFLAITNDIFSDIKHYITLFIRCEYSDGSLENCEPEKCESWEWVEWEELIKKEKDLFLPLQNLIKNNPGLKLY